MEDKGSLGLGKLILTAATTQVINNRNAEIEKKLVGAYKEIKRYCNHLDIDLISYSDFVSKVEKVRLTTRHGLNGAIQIVCNELMPNRYSY